MSRQGIVKNYNNFSAGLITEGNPLTPPENALKDMLNVELMRTGGMRPRFAIDKENTVASEQSWAGAGITDVSQTFDWDGAAGAAGTDILVVQEGDRLLFYRKHQSSDLMNQHLGTLTYAGSAGSETEPMYFANLNGLLIVGSKTRTARVISYNPAALTVSMSGTIPAFKVRSTTSITENIKTDERKPVSTMAVSGVTGTFVGHSAHAGEIIVGSTSGAQARVIKNNTTSLDVIYTTSTVSFLPSEPIQGQTSGATATVGTMTDTITLAHFLNLINQGWSEDDIAWYAYNTGYFPSNAQVWYQGRDSSGVFSPSELDKLYFGSSHAPLGYVVSDVYSLADQYGPGIAQRLMTNPAALYTYVGIFWWRGSTDRPTTATTFGGRVAFGGGPTYTKSTIFISPLLPPLLTDSSSITTNTKWLEIFNFYSVNDPTAEFSNQPLATDGLTVTISEMDTCTKLIGLKFGLIVIANNGVWFIGGPDTTSAFTADNFSVSRISKIGTSHAGSIVEVENSVLFWNDTGIWSISPDPTTGTLAVKDLSTLRIKDFFDAIPAAARSTAVGYYDRFNKRVYWSYDGHSSSTGEYRDSVLVLDVSLGAFYPYKFANPTTKANSPRILGMAQDASYVNADNIVPLKLVYNYFATPNTKTGIAELRATTSWLDWHEFDSTGASFSKYAEIHSDALGDLTRKKQSVWAFTYMEKTETGWVANGNGFDPVNPSKCSMQGRWDWNDTSASGRLTPAKEIYVHHKHYVPTGAGDTFDSGEVLVNRKTKLHGRGYSLSVKFTWTDAYDGRLLGFSIPYSVDNIP